MSRSERRSRIRFARSLSTPADAASAPSRSACAATAEPGRLPGAGRALGLTMLLGALLTTSGSLGCASAGPPTELVDARRALAEAQASSAAPSVLSELAEAQAALDRAEALYESGDDEAADAAYVAMRLADRARIAAIYRADLEVLAAARHRAERARRLLVRRAAEQAELRRVLAEEAAARPRAREVLRTALLEALEPFGVRPGGLEEPSEEAIHVRLQARHLFWPARPGLRPDARAAIRAAGAAVLAGPPSRIRVVVKSDVGAHGQSPSRLAKHRAAVLRDALAEAGLPLDRIEVESGAAKTPAEATVEVRILEDELRVASSAGKAPGKGPALKRLPAAHSF